MQNGCLLLILDGIQKLQPTLALRVLQCTKSFLSEVNGLKVIITSHTDLIFNTGTSKVSLSEIIEFTQLETFVLPRIKAVNSHDFIGRQVTLAIAFVDIVGSTELAYSLGEENYRKLMDEYFSQVNSYILRLRGEKIREQGDGHLAVFWNAGSALDYALMLQANTHPQVRIRAGIHLGEVHFYQRQGIDGLSVAYAARVIEAIDKAAEIWLSRNAKDQVEQMNRQSHRMLDWERVDSKKFQGFPGTHTLWRLQQNQ
jgi:class 3 adenylate cyclase